jgi:hypothetical protein
MHEEPEWNNGKYCNEDYCKFQKTPLNHQSTCMQTRYTVKNMDVKSNTQVTMSIAVMNAKIPNDNNAQVHNFTTCPVATTSPSSKSKNADQQLHQKQVQHSCKQHDRKQIKNELMKQCKCASANHQMKTTNISTQHEQYHGQKTMPITSADEHIWPKYDQDQMQTQYRNAQ